MLYPKPHRLHRRKVRKPLRRLTPLRRSQKPLKRLTPLRRSTKPLRRQSLLRARSKPLKRSSSDRAAFDKEALASIWGEYPQCLISPKEDANDFHHTLGRGYIHGFNRSRAERKIFASVFNACPISRRNHNGFAFLNDHRVQKSIIEAIYDRVMKAVTLGHYELQPYDFAFLRWSRENGF